MVKLKKELSKEVLELFKKDKTKELTDVIEQKIIDDLITEYDLHIRESVKKNLKKLCFEFNTELEFIDFVINRITKIQYDEKPNYFELYLDFKSYENKGILILFGKEELKLNSIEGCNLKCTIG